MRDSNDEKAWPESPEKDVSAASAQCTLAVDQADVELADDVAIRPSATAKNYEPAGARTRVSRVHASDNSHCVSSGRVVLVVGIGLGAVLSVLLYSQRSSSTASDVSAATASSKQQPATTAKPALDQVPGAVSQPAITTASAPEQIATPSEGVPSGAEAPAPPSAAEPATIDVPPSAAAMTSTDSPAPAPSHASAAPVQPTANARAPRPTATTPVIKITKITKIIKTDQPAPPPDSEEARLAAAAVRRGEDNPTDTLLDEAFAQGQVRAKQELEARNAPPAIPQVPSRDDVIKAMRALLPQIHDCAHGETGIATANLVVSNDGKVQIVGIIGQAFGGTEHGRCMEGVVRTAQLPRFQRSSFRAQFPFSVQ